MNFCIETFKILLSSLDSNVLKLGKEMANQDFSFSDQKALLERFNYVHNIIQIPHTIILKNPGILLCRNFKLKQRHLFLVKLGKAQYNPNKENYVPIMALAEDTDSEFCLKYAKCNVSDFNLFLKTL